MRRDISTYTFSYSNSRMPYTKRVSWHHRSLACVIQTNIRTEYTNVRPDTQYTHTHTHTRTTRLKRPQFGVPVHILKLLSSDLRHLESKKMPRVNNTHTLFMPLSVIERSPFPKRDICSICDKKQDADVLCTHTHG